MDPYMVKVKIPSYKCKEKVIERADAELGKNIVKKLKSMKNERPVVIEIAHDLTTNDALFIDNYLGLYTITAKFTEVQNRHVIIPGYEEGGDHLEKGKTLGKIIKFLGIRREGKWKTMKKSKDC